MTEKSTTEDSDRPTFDRRSVLAMGVGGVAAGMGLRALSGTAAAWHRFDVDFRAPDEVWFVVANDLRYDPPAIAHVIVERDDEVTCRLVEFTPENATTAPDQYDDAAVVPASVESGVVLGVLAYNRAVGSDDRFSRPRCVMPNDELSRDPFESSSIADAECVQAAVEDHWNGTLRKCWWDPLNPVEAPTTVRTTVVPDDPADGQEFGATLAIDSVGDRLVIGAPGAGDQGAVYVFRRTNGWTQQAKVTPPAEDGDVRFGRAIDIAADGKQLLVGAPPTKRGVPGCAYVYTLDDDWQVADRLRGETENPDEAFGRAVALDGTGQTALVGAPKDFRSPGAERVPGRGYVFENDSWTQSAVLKIPDEYEFFTENYSDDRRWGRTVALSDDGTTALLGNPAVGLGFGEVHAFTRSEAEWTHDSMLRSGVEDHHVGFALDLTADGAVAIIGSDVNGEETPNMEGFVDIVTETTSPWKEFESDLLTPADGEVFDRFGRAVAVDDPGETLLVGAPYRDTAAGSDAGAAYRFVLDDDDGWRLESTFVAPDGAEGERFGDGAALDSDATTGAIGAPLATVDGTRSGAVYVFENDESQTSMATRWLTAPWFPIRYLTGSE